jgi:transcriptional regulator of arginine metabolism
MSAPRRRHLIERILRREGASSQESLALALAGEGFRVTQATISRDLGALGAVKTRSGYRLPEDLASPEALDASAKLRAAVREHAREITPAGTLVVVRTAPGHSGVVADALDRADPAGVVGTIAGDDTIFIATASTAMARRIANDLLAQIEHAGGTA